MMAARKLSGMEAERYLELFQFLVDKGAVC